MSGNTFIARLAGSEKKAGGLRLSFGSSVIYVAFDMSGAEFRFSNRRLLWNGQGMTYIPHDETAPPPEGSISWEVHFLITPSI